MRRLDLIASGLALTMALSGCASFKNREWGSCAIAGGAFGNTSCPGTGFGGGFTGPIVSCTAPGVSGVCASAIAGRKKAAANANAAARFNRCGHADFGMSGWGGLA